MNPQIGNFFREVINRLGAKSPKFFLIIKIITASMTFAGYLPKLFDEGFGWNVTDYWVSLCEKAANVALGIFMGSFLPAEAKPTAMTPAGDVIGKLDDKRFPFTAESKAQEADKLEIPTIKDPLPKDANNFPGNQD